MTPGERVVVPGGHVATIVAHGACGWHGCGNGDDCVTVREDRWSTTTNYPSSKVQPTTGGDVRQKARQ